MNRVIKFRGWSKSANKLLPVVRLDWSEDGQIENDTPLMQFTGLKDKNGKEIFEGDLMLTDDEYHDYEDGVAINALPDGKIVAVDFRDGAFFGGTELLFEYATAWEIIGNLYENPDLIK